MPHGLVWSGPLFFDALPIVLSWAEHRAAGHVALALLSMTDSTYGGRRGLVALDAGEGRYVQARGGDDAIDLAAASGSFADPTCRLNRTGRQAMRCPHWDPPGPAPSHYTMSVQPPVLDMRSLADLLLHSRSATWAMVQSAKPRFAAVCPLVMTRPTPQPQRTAR